MEKKIDHEKLKRELYSAIIRHARVQNKDRKNIMKAIQEVLAKYEEYW
ncbi:MAG: hypothetical protein QHH15_04085 [Candidatus Thermoplasmatota archaeon]|nr:hypothetical protein [Candidatus Thermoplasmatota archaeon]